ncbi:hypothetical protein SCATT_46030 [Streptantibioticus cattleyicolor NRRL 8057 = DSM 46488]|uniref:Uncharacterized protein n=1 Tax=Streptantibioticus cattleyicolor (strain ATCC 35852 / DSM 46488 / JCM 4925 / NBRC 14057 / NRRL 8057) TaxID=1003195 RepID=G8X3C4_STREN|nr:hypothetical protein SCATT_46030 [Streptantibioticus cattleyicolor NRRL 8057 = DSM 46488]
MSDAVHCGPHHGQRRPPPGAAAGPRAVDAPPHGPSGTHG